MPEQLTYAAWRAALNEGRLLGQACDSCTNIQGTPKGACPHCGSRNIETVELPTHGEVYTETTVTVPPAGVEERGYQVAIVQLGEARVMGRIDAGRDDTQVAIGESVELTGYITGEDGDPAPLFRPAD
jgi:uncharacterized OB-fold protein